MRRLPQPLARWDPEGLAMDPGRRWWWAAAEDHTRGLRKKGMPTGTQAVRPRGPTRFRGGHLSAETDTPSNTPRRNGGKASQQEPKSARPSHGGVTRRIYGMNIPRSMNLSDFTSRDRPARTTRLVMSAPPPRRPHTKIHPAEREPLPPAIPLSFTHRLSLGAAPASRTCRTPRHASSAHVDFGFRPRPWREPSPPARPPRPVARRPRYPSRCAA